ncbi:MAG: vWA domain-containing protein [Planctomycetaceae bacterium]
MKHTNTSDKRRGAVIPLMAVLLPVMLILCVSAINVAYMQLTRTELQVAVDAAARAGGRAWSEYQDVDQAKQFALDAAAANKVAGAPLLLRPESSAGEVELGVASRVNGSGRYDFQPVADGAIVGSSSLINSIRVVGHRDAGSLAGSVNLLMGGVGDVKLFNPVTTSICTQTDRDIVLLLDQSGSMLFHQEFPESYGGAYRGNILWALEQKAYYEAEGGYNPLTKTWQDSYWRQKWFEMESWQIPFEKVLGYRPIAPGEVVLMPPYSRWDAAMKGLNVMLEFLEQTEQEEQVAIVTFCHFTAVHVDLTKDYEAIRSWARTYRIGGNTYPGRGLMTVDSLLETSPNVRPAAMKSVLLVGDGSGYADLVDDGINNLVEKNVEINSMSMFCVGGYSLLDYIAKGGGGSHFIAVEAQDIQDAYRKFAQTLPSSLTD